MIKSGIKTHVYCIHTARFDSFLTNLTQTWPLMTFRVNDWPILIAINDIYLTTYHIIIFHDSVMEPTFLRFTNRDRAKKIATISQFRFRDMIFYLLIFPHKHPEGIQLVKKITRYPSSSIGLVETISNCQIYSFYVISAFFTLNHFRNRWKKHEKFQKNIN